MRRPLLLILAAPLLAGLLVAGAALERLRVQRSERQLREGEAHRREERRALEAQLALEEEAVERAQGDETREAAARRIDTLLSQLDSLPPDDGPAPAGVAAAIHLFLSRCAADERHLPPSFVRRVEALVAAQRQAGTLESMVSRRRAAWPVIAAALRAERLPEPLGYVAWMESAFQPALCSGAGARGMWQLMPEAARHYGLRVDPECAALRAGPDGRCDCAGTDERVDPARSAQAATRLLGDLLASFGSESTMLALAAYNSGEESIRRQLRRHRLRTPRERSFWHLYRAGLLPDQTVEHAVGIVAGFVVMEPASPGP